GPRVARERARGRGRVAARGLEQRAEPRGHVVLRERAGRARAPRGADDAERVPLRPEGVASALGVQDAARLLVAVDQVAHREHARPGRETRRIAEPRQEALRLGGCLGGARVLRLRGLARGASALSSAALVYCDCVRLPSALVTFTSHAPGARVSGTTVTRVPLSRQTGP